MMWVLPSTIALLIKSYLFFYSDVHKQKNLFVFLGALFALNLIELIGFFRLGYDLPVLKLYYCVSALTSLYLMRTCSEISKSCTWLKSDFFLVVVGILATAILFTDYIILDFVSLPNGSISKVSGPYYFAFQLYSIAALLLSLGLLIIKVITTKNHNIKVRSFIALLAFLPPTIVVFFIMSMMQLGYQMNMAGVFSLSICFMLIIFISLNDQHKLFTMMSWIPFSWERQNHLKMSRLSQQINYLTDNQPINMKELVKSFELILIERARHQYPVQKDLARMLSISEGNLSRKIDQLNKSSH